MKFHRNQDGEVEDGESYYVSMTDMMVGIIFIFIIMLAYFALNYRATTANLTSAKDAQTAALLKIASNLKTREAQIQIDEQNHILCVGGDVLGGQAGAAGDQHCFAYTDGAANSASAATSSSDRASSMAAADQQQLISSVGSDLVSQQASPSSDKNGLSFVADDIFVPDSDQLTPEGQQAVKAAAHSLATHLPCFTGNAGANCTNDTKLLTVQVGARATIDPSTQAGRDAGALILQRTSAFYNALVAAEPSLNELHDPAGKSLIHVASGISEAPGADGHQTVYVSFRMATP